MREFLKSELENLHLKTGLQQFFKLSEMTKVVDGKEEPDGERQIRILIDSMVIVCEEFPMIPDEAKQKIISAAIVRDQDFTALNSRVVWRWLNGQKDRFMKKLESGDQQDKRVELTPDAIARIDKILDETKAGLLGQVPAYGDIEAEKQRIQHEDKERQEGKKGSGYVPPREMAVQATLDNLYLSENYNLKTGQKLSCWMEKDAWIEARFPTASSETKVK